MTANRTVVLKSRPVGKLRETDFEIVDAPLSDLHDGQIRTRNLFGSLDPGTRKLFGASDGYIQPIPIGAPFTCLVLGEVQESRIKGYAPGDLIIGDGALQEMSIVSPGPMTRVIDPTLSPSLSHHMSVLGSAGLTAYFGLLDIGEPKPGQTVLVSAASGAVGSLVGQIARLKGCRVVGIAGGPEKCARLSQEFRFDAAVDHRGKSVAELADAIQEAAPEGVDVYFDNVGGGHLDAALAAMNWGGRIAACGMISEYDSGGGQTFQNLFRVIGKILTMRGFLLFTFAERFPEAVAELAAWVRDGRLTFREQIQEGLDAAIPGYLQLFDGANEGKMMVRIAAPTP